MTRLEGERVALRPLVPEDCSVYRRIHTSRVLTRYLGIDPLTEEESEPAFVAALTQRCPPRLVFAICQAGSDQAHGLIGLLFEEYGSNAMITGLTIVPGSPVAGCGSEAARLLIAHGFGRWGLHRIWAGHRVDHPGMRPVMSAAGLRREATLRQLFRTSDRWHDVATYAALSPTWQPLNAAEEVILGRTVTTTPERGRFLSELLDRKLDRGFSQLDADGNGYVEQSDVAALAERIISGFGLAPSSEVALSVTSSYHALWKALVACADSDDDGRVSPDEFRAGLTEIATSVDGYDAFFQAAVDSLLALGAEPGKLAVEEWLTIQSAYGTPAEQATALFDQLDTDGNGFLAAGELSVAIRDYYTSIDADAPGNNLFGPLG
ncbi:GNAT family N-acetyltransferase [Kribbella sp. NPDC056861]|uniref:GNAT family N-acetyltransferase n=1 Tax=Kribbella sp. NPDC056861 TaxID=3154857 RepID=UPI0034255865